jgi:hypothetical protein
LTVAKTVGTVEIEIKENIIIIYNFLLVTIIRNKNGLNIGENVKVSIDYKTRNGFIICAPSKVK